MSSSYTVSYYTSPTAKPEEPVFIKSFAVIIMNDEQLKQLIESNAKSIAALSDAMATEREAIAADREERREERVQLYQYLGRIAAAQSNFYEVQADYYHQLAVLSERQTRTEEQIVKILKHLSITE